MGCGKNRGIKDEVEVLQRVKTLTSNTLTDGGLTQSNSLVEGKFRASNFVVRRFISIHKDYCLGRKIGQGPYGNVRQATWRKTDAPRAVKTIEKSFLETTLGNIEQFDSEISTLRSFDHPNILKLYDYIEDEAAIHLVSEL
jgi:hypothetical protein